MTQHRLCLCGNPIRLRAFKISINRKRGVEHHLDHAVTSDASARECKVPHAYYCSMMKPYPKAEQDAPWFKMLAAWDAGEPFNAR
jgi:hypothetical protein